MDVKNRTIRQVAVIAAAPCDCLNAHDARLRHWVMCELSAEDYENSSERECAEELARHDIGAALRFYRKVRA